MNTNFNFLQTEDQYIFIHDALLEAVICGNTEVAARNLHTHIQKLMQPEIGENITGMELEFKVRITYQMISFCLNHYQHWNWRVWSSGMLWHGVAYAVVPCCSPNNAA